ncbi:MAG TPA: translation initiation factor IF-2 [Patescibacteria group bacterium]|nr:translation initiation factor IF-2 [Patescibacteria group bacterium]
MSTFAPVVSVLGHVDHGKTSLLDAVRKTNIASREHGGITQKIGVSSIETLHDGQKRKITFIDTPGHETFAAMRSRGAQVADVAILVISAVDGIMPQTKESIQLIKNAGIPFIVALTKSDLPEKNPERVKRQLSQELVLVEGYGGDVPTLEVSAKTGQHIQELLDLILLLFAIKQTADSTHPSSNAPLVAVVIESRLDTKSGPRATVVVKNGMLQVKDEIIAEGITGRVRSLIDDNGIQQKTITVGDGAEILGFEHVPAVGSVVQRGGNNRQATLSYAQPVVSQEGNFSLVLCADTLGSLEAIVASLPSGVRLMRQKTGEISEADVLYAKSIGALILTFNIKLKTNIIHFARTEKVLIKNYTIIYELLDELREVIEGKRLAEMEQIYGVAQIQAKFPFEKTIVLGLKVTDGRIAKGDKIRIMRNDEQVGESSIISVRQGKETASKVEAPNECGVLISPLLDFQTGDMILSHS